MTASHHTTQPRVHQPFVTHRTQPTNQRTMNGTTKNADSNAAAVSTAANRRARAKTCRSFKPHCVADGNAVSRKQAPPVQQQRDYDEADNAGGGGHASASLSQVFFAPLSKRALDPCMHACMHASMFEERVFRNIVPLRHPVPLQLFASTASSNAVHLLRQCVRGVVRACRISARNAALFGASTAAPFARACWQCFSIRCFTLVVSTERAHTSTWKGVRCCLLAVVVRCYRVREEEEEDAAHW